MCGIGDGARGRDVAKVNAKARNVAGVFSGACHGHLYRLVAPAGSLPGGFLWAGGLVGCGGADFALGTNGMALTQRLSEGEAIQTVWSWFLRNRSRDVPATEIVARVRALAPGAAVERIRVEFGKRLRRARR